MKRFILLSLLVFAWFYGENSLKAQNMASQRPEDIGFSSERLQKIDTFIEKCIKEGVFPHAQALIIRHGKIVYLKSFGWKNIAEKTVLKNDDIFRLASQTKAVTTVAMMILYEEGLFLLDDPVSKYIPEFKNMKVLKNPAIAPSPDNLQDCKTEITLRHLLTHTSGIPYYDRNIYNKFPLPGLTLEDVTLAQIIPQFASLPLFHQPGEAFTYGYSLDVAGYLVEKLSGMKLDEFFEKRIFEPLEMHDTYFYLPKEKESRLIALHEKKSRNSQVEISTNDLFQNYPIKGARKFFAGGAGLVGTIEDYSRLCQMLLNKGSYKGKQLLSPKTVELMTKNQVGNLPLWNTGNRFGLGFEIMTDQGLQNILGSVGSYKWGGMFGSEYVIDPTEDMITIFYSNVFPWEEKNEILAKYRILAYQALIK